MKKRRIMRVSCRKCRSADKGGERILAHIKEDAYVIALAIDGKQRSSEEMAA